MILSDRKGTGIGDVVALVVVIGGTRRLEQRRAGMILNERDALEFSGQTGCF